MVGKSSNMQSNLQKTSISDSSTTCTPTGHSYSDSVRVLTRNSELPVRNLETTLQNLVKLTLKKRVITMFISKE